MDKEELRIVNKAKAGDEKSLATLIVKYDAALTQLANYFLNSFKNTLSLDFDELKQDALMAFLKSVSSYDNAKNKSLYNYSKICIINALTSTIRKKRSESPEPDFPIEPGEGNPGIDIVCPKPGPEQDLENKETQEKIKETFKKILSDIQYNVMDLYFAGYSYSEIANTLNISKKTVDNTIAASKKKISENKDLFTPILG